MPSPSRSPTTPPVASEWSCVRCTLLNPDHSDSCVACEASRPVEVDIDSPVVVGAALALASPKRSRRKNERSASPPPQRFGRKREHDASPEVVELCDIAGKGPATKKGNLEICLDKKTFKIMTYNVWFREDLELRSRMDALGDLIKQHCPDFICFQEVTPYIYMLMQKSDWWQQYTCLLSHENAIQMPYYCMQLSKMPTKPSDCIPFSNSTMGRELCIASVRTGEITKLILATTHLESPCPAPPKWDQMYSKERVAQAKQSLEILGGFPNAILCGDMNWDDKGDGPFPLQDGWTDAWVELKPGEDGWTYDTKANGMLSGNRKLQKRLDRFVCKLADFKMDSIEMIGKEAIPGVSYFKEKKIRKENQRIELPVFPSDHFGLVLTITQQKDDNV
ncbi:Endonuclease/Exonuclease/phosphatase family [Zea mays]|uniref:Endonuclease/Exonuclease/phosphatase family protein n=2 Tax=Zea mays TaxID=4577 RepID=B4F826_MAIZE|nr:Endonuclease/Exonuclease/phosphatase family [Zea mays]ACF78269.1 unknown [Zea mays]ACG34748.1 endonuclease/Exonuclease/phosphatase family protein [Zea mays]|eukprot:NP_001130134.1 Endonuclease/Exonuclease/phosphatase family [Zea mays]